MKHRGVICDKCGVEVTLSKVRASASAHRAGFTLLARMVFKGLPSRIGYLLDISMRDLERILYFEAFVVVDPGEVAILREREVLLETNIASCRRNIRASSRKDGRGSHQGAAAPRRSGQTVRRAPEKMKTDPSLQKRIKFAKRLKVLEPSARVATSRSG